MSSSDDIKSSARVWGGNGGGRERGPGTGDDEGSSSSHQHDEVYDLPPAYPGEDEERGEQQRPTPPSRPTRTRTQPKIPKSNPIQDMTRLFHVPFARYHALVPEATVSADRVTVTTEHGSLLSNPQTLLGFVVEQAALPPTPILCIRGAHGEPVGLGSDPGITDFDIRLNLSSMLTVPANLTSGASPDANSNGGRTPRWNIPSTSASGSTLPEHAQSRQQAQPTSNQGSGSGPGSDTSGTISEVDMSGLRIWVSRFCKDKSEAKSFTLTRSVAGLPIDLIEGQIRILLASLRYRGKVTVSCEIQHAQVIVQKRPSNWFVSMLRLSSPNRYDVVETVWDALGCNRADVEDKVGGGDDAGAAVFRNWWTNWAGVIRNAVIAKRRGRIGVEDWIEAEMGYSEKEPRYDWGVV